VVARGGSTARPAAADCLDVPPPWPSPAPLRCAREGTHNFERGLHHRCAGTRDSGDAFSFQHPLASQKRGHDSSVDFAIAARDMIRANAFSFFFFALFFSSSAIFARVSLSLPPIRSPPLLHSLHQPLRTTALSRRQGIALAFERILVGAEFDAYRRAFESEGLAEDVAEIAAIGVGDVLHLV